MTRDVTRDLGKLCGLAGAVACGVAYGVGPLWGLGVAVAMLGLLSLAFVSPMGPTVMFELPQEVDR